MATGMSDYTSETQANPFGPNSALGSPPTGAPSQVPYQYAAPAQTGGSGKITGAYICAVLSLLILPIIFGPVAIWLASKAGDEGHSGAGTARIVAICCMIAGFALGALMLMAN